MEPRNRFQGMNSASLCSLAGRYDNPIHTRCLNPIGCSKIPALSAKLFLQSSVFGLPQPPAHSLAGEGVGEYQFQLGDRHCGTLWLIPSSLDHKKLGIIAIHFFKGGICLFFFLFKYVFHHFFICRPLDSTALELEDARIEPRTVAKLALTL
jgi:hypothetical protein